MEEVNAWRKSLEIRLNLCDDFLGKAKPVVDAINTVQEVRAEITAKLAFMDAMPVDYLSERAPQFLSAERGDEERLRLNLPSLPDVTPHNLSLLSSTGGTVLYAEALQDTSNPYASTESASSVLTMFNELAEEKARNAALPAQLDKINRELGKQFTIAKDSVGKAKVGVQTVSQSAIALRDVLEQIWGGLVNITRQRADGCGHTLGRLELDNPTHRGYVAQYMTADLPLKVKLESALISMRALWTDLSNSHFGKNLLGDDTAMLENKYHLWILIISEIIALVDI